MTPRELAEGTRARFVVRGTLLPVGDSLRLRATVLDAADGARLTEVDLRGDAHGVDRMADSLTMETLRAVAQVMPLVAVRLRQPSLGTRSLVALKAFLQGEQYYRTNRLDSAQHSYERAIQKDSGFALAYSRMRSVLRATAAEDDPRSMWFALRAAERSRGLSPRDSLLVLADSLYAAATEFARATPPWHALVRRRLRTLEQLTQRYPDDPEGWHELGEARHHHGESVAIDQRQALDAFGRAIALDPDFTPSYFHAVELSLGMGDVAGARSYLAAYLRPDRSDSALAFVRRLLDDSTARASGAVWDSLPLAVAARAAYAIRRWPDAAEPALRAYDRLRSTIHAPDEWMVDSLSLRIFALAERLYRGHVADAYAAADGALLAASPPFYVQHLALLDAMPVGVADSLFSAWSHGSDARRRVLALAWWAKRRDDRALAETGRACAKASRRAALVEPSARLAPPTAQQRAAQQTAALGEYCVAVTAAYRALVAGDTAGAIDAFAAVPDSLCQWGCVADRLARARLLIAVGHDRDAAAVLDARPPMPDALSAGDALWSFERARVAERLADTARAVAAYRAVAETWRHADAPLQRYVRDARNALARLRRAAG
jgi:tetratricopeptide (TPR) repeat protein